jgi:hypothetical protein
MEDEKDGVRERHSSLARLLRKITGVHILHCWHEYKRVIISSRLMIDRGTRIQRFRVKQYCCLCSNPREIIIREEI